MPASQGMEALTEDLRLIFILGSKLVSSLEDACDTLRSSQEAGTQ